MTSSAIVNKINLTENLSGYIDFVPEEEPVQENCFSKKEDREKVLSKIMLLQRANWEEHG